MEDIGAGAAAGGAREDGWSRFSARAFEARALRAGHPLEDADAMLRQPVTYGLDAGRPVDADGNLLPHIGLNHFVGDDDWRECAVLVPVVARAPEVTVLLTRRTAHLKSHAGQIAFPGGKIEAQDATPIDTALREAFEEIGVTADLIRPLSLLDLHKTGTGFRIVPVLSLVSPDYTARPDPSEVDDVFEIPLSFLMCADNHQRHYAEWKGHRRLFYAMTYGNRFVWGATAAILRNLYERLYAT